MWKLAEKNIISRGKRHFAEKYDEPIKMTFGKRVYACHNATIDTSKLELTKSGKTKIEYIPQKKRYKPSKLKLIEIDKTKRNKVDIVAF